MSKSMLRWAVIVLTLITGLVHLYLGVTNVGGGPLQTLGILWLLNAIGYATLLGGFLGVTPVLKDNKPLTHYALIGYAAVTIVAWFVLGDKSDKLGIATKVDEVLLIIATYMHMRKS